MSEALLEARGVTVHFRRRRHGPSVTALDQVTLSLSGGETLGLVGESGSGKSTLARVLLGLVTPASGDVRFRGTSLAGARGCDWQRLRRSVQIVFQDPAASLNPRMRVATALAEPLEVYRGDLDARAVARRSCEMLDAVGLSAAHLERYPGELSGGQCQRVAIARALMLEPEVLICDEPVSSLDVSVQAQMLKLLATLQARLGLAILFIAHDLGVVRYLCQRVAVMYRGALVELGPSEQVLGNPLHPYTRALLASVPIPDPRMRAPAATVPDVPATRAPEVGGCAYLARCSLAVERCQFERPSLQALAEGHAAACHVLVGPRGAQ